LIKLKPLSVNRVWQGKRFKTKEYKEYETVLSLLLPKGWIPEGRLKISLEFGFSSKNSDIDNCVKPFCDVLQFKYGFNDNRIYEMNLKKEIVKKGEEYIRFLITSI